MNVGPYVLPALALMVLAVVTYIAIQWIYRDPDEVKRKPGAKSAEQLGQRRPRR